MITIRFSASLLLGCFFLALGLSDMEAVQAGELKFRVQLIWGTKDDKAKDLAKEDQAAKEAKAASPANNDKVKERPLKEVDPKLAENLKKIFTWEHYYEMFRKEPVSIRDGVAEKLSVSPKCEVEIKNLGKSMLEVRLFGEGKLVKTVKQASTPGEYLTIGGDDKKNDSAWFVVLTPL